MFCPSCGNETPDGSIFCINCGLRVNKECPRCAEIIKVKAKVCRFCGYEFTAEELIEIEQVKQNPVSQNSVSIAEAPEPRVEEQQIEAKQAEQFTYTAPSPAPNHAPSAVEHPTVTVEEQKLLELLAQGHSNIEIADILGASTFDIQDQFSARIHASLLTQELLKKFGVKDKAELINQARQKGYLPPQ